VKSKNVRIAVLLGSVSVIGIIVFQAFWINRTYDITENQFTQQVQIALYDVAENVLAFNGKELPNENPVRQITSNYFIVDINDVIDANILDHYLKTEFEFRQLNVDYEYAIYDCETDEMVFGNYISQDEVEGKKSVKFQKYDEFTYYFGILFPSKQLYIIKSMNVLILSSFIILTAIIFFTYAIYVILKQKRLSEIQKDFINNMTHEFKTPISTIGISASVLADKTNFKDPDRLRNYADIITSQNNRLERQVDKILQLGRLESDNFSLKFETVDARELVEDVVDNILKSREGDNGRINTRFDAEDHNIEADKYHFTNLIYNLLDNAFKYSSADPNITITSKNQKNTLLFSISDNGIGIDKQHKKKIFRNFYRIPSGDIHNVKGFGIGLNYVKKIVERHHWKIDVDSEPGKGSTFTVKIPL
jgi:two-component system phosphate regulon sensor histidine kinase PhoR